MGTYYQIIGEPEIAFNTEVEALDYDIEINPELHGTKEDSHARFENAIVKCSWDELNRVQQDFLSSESIFDNDGNDVS